MNTNTYYFTMHLAVLSLTLTMCASSCAQSSTWLSNQTEVARQRGNAQAMRVHASYEKRNSGEILRTIGMAKDCTVNIGSTKNVKGKGNPLGNQGGRGREEFIFVNTPITTMCR